MSPHWPLKAMYWLGMKEPPDQATLDPIDPEVTVEPVATHVGLQDQPMWPASRFVIIGLLGGIGTWWLIILSRSPGFGSITWATIMTVIVMFIILRIVRGPVETLVNDIEKPKHPTKRTLEALAEGEVLLWEDREHPIGLIGWWIALIILQPATIAIAVHASMLSTMVVWVVSMLIIAIRMYAWDINRISLTDKRIIVITGLFHTNQEEIYLSKLAEGAAKFNRVSTALAFLRIITRHYATLRFESSGGDKDQGIDRVVYITNGHAVSRLIRHTKMYGYKPPSQAGSEPSY